MYIQFKNIKLSYINIVLNFNYVKNLFHFMKLNINIVIFFLINITKNFNLNTSEMFFILNQLVYLKNVCYFKQEKWRSKFDSNPKINSDLIKMQ